jgi:hypothetical protein
VLATPKYALCLVALLTSLSTSAAGQTTPGPCRVIRLACLKAGFEPGSGAADVESACVRPIVYGTTPTKRAKLPTVDPKIVAECRANLDRSRQANAPGAPSESKPPTTPSSTDAQAATSTRQPTAVSPHNPPPTNPGPDRH